MTETNKYHPVIATYIAAVENIDGGVTVDDFAAFEFSEINPGGSNGSIDQNVLLRPKFKQLRKLIQREVNEYCKALNPLHDNLEWPIVTSWITKTPPGACVSRHFHRHSLYSGVYYPPGQKEVEPLIVEYAIPYLNVLQPADFGTALNAVPGSLFIFPSSYPHFTREIMEEVPRYSLAFNVFFSGEIKELTGEIKVKASHI